MVSKNQYNFIEVNGNESAMTNYSSENSDVESTYTRKSTFWKSLTIREPEGDIADRAIRGSEKIQDTYADCAMRVQDSILIPVDCCDSVSSLTYELLSKPNCM